jgi:sialidase-1
MHRYLAIAFFSCALFNTPFAQEVKPLPYDAYVQIRGGLQHSYAAITQQHQVTVAYLGGSITFNPGWRDKVDSFLRTTYPTTRFRSIKAGIPSLGSLPHAFRLQRDLLDSGKIDLLFIEAAVNDRVNGTDSLTQLRALEGIVRHAGKANPNIDIILMSFADTDKTNDYNKQQTPPEIANHELVATHYNLPSVNLGLEVHDRIQHGEFSWQKDFRDVHPSPFGQQLYFASIRELLVRCFAAAGQAGVVHLKKQSLPAVINEQRFEHGNYYDIAHAKTDSNWSIAPDWTPTDGLHTRPGFVHRPMLVATTADAALTLQFKGTAIGMAIVSGSDAGLVTYSIDGSPYQNIDLFTQWSKSLHLPWYVLFSGDLKSGMHVLQLKVAPEKNARSAGNACRIVYFLVNDK